MHQEKDKHHKGSPLDWIKGLIAVEQPEHLGKPTNTNILAGDFNARWHPGKGGSNSGLPVMGNNERPEEHNSTYRV